jgi:hypothetical protein
MGVDISGKNPIIRSPKPKTPNWQTASEQEKEKYFELDSKWNKENPGDYFRASWWGWRPLAQLCETVDSIHSLGIDFQYWGSNDGKGLETQEECNKLADALESFVSKIDFVDDEDWFGIYTGSWSTLEGGFVDKKITDKLDEQYQWGDVIRQSIMTDSGTIVEPSHKVYKVRIDTFINFLRECGGFTIY